MNIFDLSARILLDSDDYEKNLDKASEKTNAFGTGAKKVFSTFAKVAVAGASAAATGIGKLVQSSVESYAEYEQLVGGVETLFKDSASKVMEYANSAYINQQMSANDYMDTVTSFSASLLQGLGGDTAKAADVANLAVTDMADNANKMGTSMESIQNAYQGFAKQNYTMLDNLKLGYGGTQAEMVRLINDSGVLDETISSMDGITFDTMIEAIHRVQDNLGITGTSAEEAMTTIEGSVNATKSAWQNLLTGMADDNADIGALVDNLVVSASAAVENIFPRIEKAMEGIGTLVDTLLPKIMDKFPEAVGIVVPRLLDAGIKIVNALIDGVTQSIGTITQAVFDIITQVGTTIIESIPTLLASVLDAITQIVETINENGTDGIVNAVGEILLQVLETIVLHLPELLLAIAEFLGNLLISILTALGGLLVSIAEWFGGLLGSLGEWLGGIFTSIGDWFMSLGASFVEWLGGIFNSIAEWSLGLGASVIDWLGGIFTSIGDWFMNLGSNLGSWLAGVLSSIVGWFANLGSNIGSWLGKTLSSIGDWGMKMGAKAYSAMKDMVGKVGEAISGLPNKLLNIGKDMIKGLWNGITGMFDWVMDKIGGFCDSIIGGIKGIFGIHSPSKVFAEIGNFCVEGFSEGMEDLADGSAVEEGLQGAIDAFDGVDPINVGVIGSIDAVPQTRTIEYTIADAVDRRISAMESTLTNVINAISNQKVVLDSGIVVGALTDDLDTALGMKLYNAGRRV